MLATEDLEGVCEHKSVFPHLPIEYLGLFFVFFFIVTSSMGGLGGGGSIIPVAILFFGFDTKQAIGLSNSSIAVASIYRYLYNFNKPHPLKDGKGVMVEYNMAALMLPPIVVGASTGVKMHIVLPEVIIVIILCVLLLFLSFTTGKKWCKIIAEERTKFGPVCGKK